MQMMLPWATSLDVAYTGRHNYNAQVGGQDFPININTIDFGTAFNPALQDRTLAPNAVPGASSLAAQNPNQVRGYRGYGTITLRQYDGWRTFHSMELSVNRRFRNGLQFGFNDTIVLSDVAQRRPAVRPRTRRPAGAPGRSGRGAGAPRQPASPRHNIRRPSCGSCPTPVDDNAALKALGLIVNDWQLSGIWTGTSGSAYTVSPAYQTGNANVNLTGSPDFAPRIRIVGDPGIGLQQRPLPPVQHRRVPGTAGRERGARVGERLSVRLLPERARPVDRAQHPAGRQPDLQLRVDMFNAPNRPRITGAEHTLQLSSPADPVTPLNLPFDANGNVLPNRVQPNQAGFGAANAYQAPRTIQAYIRFGF